VLPGGQGLTGNLSVEIMGEKNIRNLHIVSLKHLAVICTPIGHAPERRSLFGLRLRTSYNPGDINF